MKKYVSKEIQFAYPDTQGKTKMESFKLIAEVEDAEKFTKFMNYLASLVKATGNEPIPIHDYSSILENPDTSKPEHTSKVIWSSWICPVKDCDRIIYNTGSVAMEIIDMHQRKHERS